MNKPISALIIIASTAILAFLAFQNRNEEQLDYVDMIDSLVDAGIFQDSSHLQNKLLDERSLVLSREVNQMTSERIISSLLLLNAQDTEKDINLYLLTSGGWLSDAFGIINAMNTIEAPVNTIAIGDVSSSGAVILAGGTGKRMGYENSIIMVHANREKGSGEYNWASLDFERFSSFWRQYSNIPEKWTKIEGDESFYLSAKQALEYGIIDEIIKEADNGNQ